mgnify:CR=1 FL=1
MGREIVVYIRIPVHGLAGGKKLKSDYDTVVMYDLQKLNEVTESNSRPKPAGAFRPKTILKSEIRLTQVDREIMREVNPEVEALLAD